MKQKEQKALMQAALGGVLALSLGAAPSVFAAEETDAAESETVSTERCAGIVKEGMNDCATSEHSCAGQASEDYHPEEWITLPAGTCEKIVGGVVLEGDNEMSM